MLCWYSIPNFPTHKHISNASYKFSSLIQIWLFLFIFCLWFLWFFFTFSSNNNSYKFLTFLIGFCNCFSIRCTDWTYHSLCSPIFDCHRLMFVRPSHIWLDYMRPFRSTNSQCPSPLWTDTITYVHSHVWCTNHSSNHYLIFTEWTKFPFEYRCDDSHYFAVTFIL